MSERKKAEPVPASFAQIKFVDDLLQQRLLNPEFKASVEKALGDGLTKAQAKKFIPLMLALPRAFKDPEGEPASDAQKVFVDNLLHDRTVPADLLTAVESAVEEGLTKGKAMRFIPLLKACKKKVAKARQPDIWDYESNWDHTDGPPF